MTCKPYLVFFVFVLFTFTGFAQYSGSYAVGGFGARFSTLSIALDSLKSFGISGTVSLNLAKGTISENIHLDTVRGSSHNSRIKIIGFGNQETVFQNAQTATGIGISGGYYSIQNVYVKQDGSAKYQRGIEIYSGARDIEINNCKFLNLGIYSNMNSSLSLNIDSLNIHDNVFYNGRTAIYLRGYGPLKSILNLSISNNQFKASGINSFNPSLLGSKAVELIRVNKTLISGNTIERRKDQRLLQRGIDMYECSSVVIEKNKINIETGGVGIYLNQVGNTFGKNRLENNFISIGGIGENFGIWVDRTDISCYHNTIRMYKSKISVSAYSGSNNDFIFYNNLVISDGLYKMLDCQNFNGGNNVYCYPGITAPTGSYFAEVFHFKNIDYNFSNWKSQTREDTSSAIICVPLKDNIDLHVFDSILWQNGRNLGIQEDIDGEIRATLPCIGADEFWMDSLDLKISKSPKNICQGNAQSSILLTNYGIQRVDSCNVLFRIDTLLGSRGFSAVSFKNLNLNPGEDTLVEISSFFFDSKKRYMLDCYLSSVNGRSDSNLKNDTLSIANAAPSLSGDIFIGGINSDFSSLPIAINYLYNFGICGPVVLNTMGIAYQDQIKFDGKIKGASAVNTITVSSGPGVRTSIGRTDEAVILFDTDFIRIKNLNLTSTGSRPVIRVDSGSTNIQIIGNRLVSNNKLHAGFLVENVGVYIGHSYSEPNNNITIDSNQIIYGVAGVSTTTFPVIPHGSIKDQALIYNISISNNSFSNQRGRAIYLRVADSIEIIRNKIDFTSLKPNRIYGFEGVHINNCNQINFHYNDIDVQADTGNQLVGVHFTGIGNNFGKLYMTNNFVSALGTGLRTTGLYVAGSAAQVGNNSIYCKSNDITSIAFTSLTALEAYNNVFELSGKGISFFMRNSFNRTNYNVYRNDSSVIGRFNGRPMNFIKGFINYNTLAFVSGTDSNSLNTDTKFRSMNDLHSKSTGLDGAGIPLSSVLDDIDGDLRNSINPDIGADEITLYSKDAKPELLTSITDSVCADLSKIEWRILNDGITSINNIAFSYNVYKNVILDKSTPYTHTGSLAPNAFSVYSDSSYLFNANFSYKIEIVVNTVGNLPDNNVFNDTIVFNPIITSLPQIFVKSIPDFCINGVKDTLGFASTNKGSISYSGNAILQNVFIPDSGIIGNNRVQVVVKDSNRCSAILDTVVLINSTPSLIYSGDSIFCEYDSLYTFKGGFPVGGSWSLNSVVATSFDPATQKGKSNNLSYSFTDLNGCSDSILIKLKVFEKPALTVIGQQGICNYNGLFSLHSVLPQGGIYIGLGVTSDTLINPINSGLGNLPDSVILNYSYKDSIGCVDTVDVKVRINPTPLVSVSSQNIACETDTAVYLKSGTPWGGYYFGQNIDSVTGRFNAIKSGPGTFDFHYTQSNSFSCNDTVKANIVINLKPDASLGPDTALCNKITEITLSPNDTGSSVLWSTGLRAPTLKVTKKGQYVVRVTNGSCRSLDTIQVGFNAICVGVEYNGGSGRTEIQLYPNPSSGRYNLEFNKIEETLFLIITNVNGTIVHNEELILNSDDYSFELNEPSGTYILSLYTEKSILLQKRIILK